MLTVLTVVGTRPEVIKMAPVLKELRRHETQIQSVVCAAGQHRHMLDQALSLFDITPHFDLNLMRENQTLSGLTAALFSGLSQVVNAVRPDWVLAQGDTTTVFATAMVASYLRVGFAHVEAGLRSGDIRRPFPEEINRRIADIVADICFAPTETARRALLSEGRSDADIVVTGNTVVDALQDVAARPYNWQQGPLASVPEDARLVLITAHRRESFGEPFRELCLALRDLCRSFMGERIHFVYPMHLNPNVREPVTDILTGLPNLSLMEPIDYVSLVHLMKRSSLILTDSGGIQEEAPAFQVPVLVLRDCTERPEGVEAGVARLVGTERGRILAEAEKVLRNPAARQEMGVAVNPYGDGRAAARIVEYLRKRPIPYKSDGARAAISAPPELREAMGKLS